MKKDRDKSYMNAIAPLNMSKLTKKIIEESQPNQAHNSASSSAESHIAASAYDEGNLPLRDNTLSYEILSKSQKKRGVVPYKTQNISNEQQRLTNTIDGRLTNIDINIVYILLRRSDKTIDLLHNFAEKNKKGLDHALEIFRAYSTYQSTQDETIAQENSDTHKNEDPSDVIEIDRDMMIDSIHYRLPQYSRKSISDLHTIVELIYESKSMRLNMLNSENPQLIELATTYEKEQDQLLNQFISVLTSIIPSIRTINNDLRKIYKNYNDMKTELDKVENQLKELDAKDYLDAFYEEYPVYYADEYKYRIHATRFIPTHQIIHNMSQDAPYLTKNQRKRNEKLALTPRELGEVYVEYMIIYAFLLEITTIQTLSVTIEIHAFRAGQLIETIVNSFYELSIAPILEMLGPKHAITKKVNQMNNYEKSKPIKDKLIPVAKDARAIEAFNMLSLDKYRKDQTDVFDRTLDLSNTLISMPLSFLNEGFAATAYEAPLPTEIIEHSIDVDLKDMDVWYAIELTNLATRLAEETDPETLALILQQTAARNLTAFSVLSYKNKKSRELAISYQAQLEAINQAEKEQDESLHKQIAELTQQVEELTPVSHQLKQQETENNRLTQRIHELDKQLAPYDQLKLKYDELTRELAQQKQANNELQNEMINVLLSANTDLNNDQTIGYDKETIIDMLNTDTVVVIGGHDQWRAALQRILPEVKIIVPEHNNASLKSIRRAEIVIVNTGTLNHPIFWKVRNEFAFNKNGTLCYINGQGSSIDLSLQTIYKQLFAD